MWLKLAKQLPLRGRLRTSCTLGCSGSSTNMLVTHTTKGYSAYCFKCKGAVFERKATMTIADLKTHPQDAHHQLKKMSPHRVAIRDAPEEARLWLYKSSIDAETAVQYSIMYCPTTHRVILPVCWGKGRTVGYQARALHPKQKPKYITETAPYAFSWYRSEDNDISQVVLVEDIVSAIRINQAGYDVIAMLGTNFHAHLWQTVVLNYKKCITWFDSDSAGRRAARTVQQQLKLVEMPHRDVCTPQDPKVHSTKAIKLLLSEEGNCQLN